MNDLIRPIIGIENRTAQEVFDIMVDRFKLQTPPVDQMGVAEGTRHLNIVDGKIYVFVSEADGLVAFKREGRETLRYLSRDEFDKRFFTLVQGSDTTTSNAMLDVLIERHRQVMTEGWTPEHDDAHTDYSLSKAAAIYAVGATFDGPDRSVMDTHGAAGTPGWMKDLWPWDIKWWKPSDRRRDLVKAAALILAEIERLDRAAITEGNQ